MGDRGVALRWLIVVVALALVVSACTGDGDERDPVEENEAAVSTTIPPAQTLLRVGAEDWPTCLNPITCDSEALREQVLQHVLPVAFEVDGAGEYQPSPLLDSEPTVDVGDGGMTVTYTLDPEARWEDGQPITSSDFRGTWQAMMSTPGADVRGYDLITGVDDEDPTVAIVRFRAPYGDWKELFGGGRGWVLQADSFGADPDLTDLFADELPFSAAPYRLAAWDESSAVLTRSDLYWRQDRLPSVDQVRLIRVTVDALEDPGAFHVLLPAGADAAAAPEGFAAGAVPTTNVLGVWFDQRTPILEPLAHRQALAALIDREALVAELDTDRSVIDCLGWLPGVGPWCDAAGAELVAADTALARYVLALAGWQVNEAGDLVRGAEPFAVPVSHDPDVPGAEAVAAAVVEAFESVGVTVVRYEVPTQVWIDTRGADPQTGVGVFPFDVGHSPQVTRLYGCLGGVPTSVLAWCPSDIVEPTARLAATVEPAAQLDLVEEIGAVAASDVAWVPIRRQSRPWYLQRSEVEAPEDAPQVGGPLAGLYDFSRTE